MGFLDENTIPTNLVLIIPDASLYHFGVLTSNVHMAWTRAVCGRLKSDYRYSKDIVYNNFPWCTPTEEQKHDMLAKGEMISKGGLPPLMIYQTCGLDEKQPKLSLTVQFRLFLVHLQGLDSRANCALGLPRL